MACSPLFGGCGRILITLRPEPAEKSTLKGHGDCFCHSGAAAAERRGPTFTPPPTAVVGSNKIFKD